MRCRSVFLSRGLNNKGKHRAEKSQDSRRKPYRFRVRQTRLFDYKAEDKADYTSCAQLQYAEVECDIEPCCRTLMPIVEQLTTWNYERMLSEKVK